MLYLVHDTDDPAVKRRLRMLQLGGAPVRLAGFRRVGTLPELPGVELVDFGLTKPGQLKARMLSVLSVCLRPWRYRAALASVDVVLCRNLECLLVGLWLAALFGQRPRLVYECLDIHRVMLGEGRASRALRAVERWLCRRCALLLTSSPAFVDQYFKGRNRVETPVLLVENKVFAGAAPPPAAAPRPAGGPPGRIGWFGVIRCRRSLDILCRLAERSEGRVEVVIRGRPALHEFDDFHGQVARTPHVRFEGAYRNPDDLAAIYGEVHFTWAIDFFEAGLNSSWLLPNRLYEGCLYGCVPLADQAVETGRWLVAHGVGLPLPDCSADTVSGLLEGMTAARYDGLSRAVAALPSATWLAGREECEALVRALAGHAA